MDKAEGVARPLLSAFFGSALFVGLSHHPHHRVWLWNICSRSTVFRCVNVPQSAVDGHSGRFSFSAPVTSCCYEHSSL